MPGIADKFTQSAQSRLLWPGMTKEGTDLNGYLGHPLKRRDHPFKNSPAL